MAFKDHLTSHTATADMLKDIHFRKQPKSSDDNGNDANETGEKGKARTGDDKISGDAASKSSTTSKSPFRVDPNRANPNPASAFKSPIAQTSKPAAPNSSSSSSSGSSSATLPRRNRGLKMNKKISALGTISSMSSKPNPPAKAKSNGSIRQTSSSSSMGPSLQKSKSNTSLSSTLKKKKSTDSIDMNANNEQDSTAGSESGKKGKHPKDPYGNGWLFSSQESYDDSAKVCKGDEKEIGWRTAKYLANDEAFEIGKTQPKKGVTNKDDAKNKAKEKGRGEKRKRPSPKSKPKSTIDIASSSSSLSSPSSASPDEEEDEAFISSGEEQGRRTRSKANGKLKLSGSSIITDASGGKRRGKVRMSQSSEKGKESEVAANAGKSKGEGSKGNETQEKMSFKKRKVQIFESEEETSDDQKRKKKKKVNGGEQKRNATDDDDNDDGDDDEVVVMDVDSGLDGVKKKGIGRGKEFDGSINKKLERKEQGKIKKGKKKQGGIPGMDAQNTTDRYAEFDRLNAELGLDKLDSDAEPSDPNNSITLSPSPPLRAVSNTNTKSKSRTKPQPLPPGARLCPFCSSNLPEQLSPKLEDLLQYLKNLPNARPKPTKENPDAIGGLLMSEMAGFCGKHKDEVEVIPEGKKRGWPTEIDWTELPKRINELCKIVMPIASGEEISPFHEIAKKEWEKKGARQMRNVMAEMDSFDVEMPGYYGERGFLMMHKQLQDNLFHTFILQEYHCEPLDCQAFIRRVLVPEVALRLIQEDMNLNTREEAIKELEDSRLFGKAVWGHAEEGDEDIIAEAEEKEQAEAKARAEKEEKDKTQQGKSKGKGKSSKALKKTGVEKGKEDNGLTLDQFLKPKQQQPPPPKQGFRKPPRRNGPRPNKEEGNSNKEAVPSSSGSWDFAPLNLSEQSHWKPDPPPTTSDSEGLCPISSSGVIAGNSSTDLDDTDMASDGEEPVIAVEERDEEDFTLPPPIL